MSRGPLFTFDITCLGAPLQIEGTASGRPYYFRARHRRWRLELDGLMIADGQGEPSVPMAVALIVQAVWAHYLVPELNAREDEQYERTLRESFGGRGAHRAP